MVLTPSNVNTMISAVVKCATNMTELKR